MSVELEDIVWLGVVTIAGCFQLATFAQKVGDSRRKFKIDPPCMDGDPEFVRTVRAQQNSLEYFPLFMGCLWISGLFFHQIPAAIIGVYYMHCRSQYFDGYVREAKGRLRPFKRWARALRIYVTLALLGLAHTLLVSYAGIDAKATLVHYFKGFTGF